MINLLLWEFDTRILLCYVQSWDFLSVQLMVRWSHVAGGLQRQLVWMTCHDPDRGCFYIATS